MKITLSKQAASSHLGQEVQHERVVEGDRLLAGDNWEYSRPFQGITKTLSVPWHGVAGRTVEMGRLRDARQPTLTDWQTTGSGWEKGGGVVEVDKGRSSFSPCSWVWWCHSQIWEERWGSKAAEQGSILAKNGSPGYSIHFKFKLYLQAQTWVTKEGMLPPSKSATVHVSGYSRDAKAPDTTFRVQQSIWLFSIQCWRSILFWVSRQRPCDLLSLIINNQNIIIIINKINNRWEVQWEKLNELVTV